MDNIIDFKIPKKVTANDSESWGVIREAAIKDFSNAGVPALAERFLKHFEPIYLEFELKLPMPNIHDDTELHNIWRSQQEDMIKELNKYRSKLIRDRYMRELEIFCSRL